LTSSGSIGFQLQITKLLNYQISDEHRRQENALKLKSRESGHHEGSGISKKDLRQVQDRAPQGRGARDLRELETQTETRVDFVI
jgi:hypothetical protein